MSSAHDHRVICCATGISKDDERSLQTQLQALEGEYTKHFSRNVSHLIVKRVGSDKHRYALQIGNCACVSMDWIVECTSRGVVLPATDFPVPVFAGLEITVTQVDMDTRDRFQKLVESRGGRFSRTLEVGVTTHLIACEGSGEKFNCAYGQLHVVRPVWIDDCVQANAWLPEDSYKVVPLEQDSAADMSLKPATEYADPIERSRAQYRAAERQANAERKIENNAFDYSSDINMLEWDRIFEMLPSTDGKFESKNLEEDTFFVVGVDPSILYYCMRLVFLAGAKLHQVLTEKVTKVVLGPNADARIRSEIRKHPNSPRVVTLKWLVEINGLHFNECKEPSGSRSVNYPDVSSSSNSNKHLTHQRDEDSEFASDILDISGQEFVAITNLFDPQARLRVVESRKRKAKSGNGPSVKSVIVSSTEALKALTVVAAAVPSIPPHPSAAARLEIQYKQPKLRLQKQTKEIGSLEERDDSISTILSTRSIGESGVSIDTGVSVVVGSDDLNKTKLSTRGSRLAARTTQQQELKKKKLSEDR